MAYRMNYIMNKDQILKLVVLCFFLCFSLYVSDIAHSGSASLEKDPIKATQTDPVPVTKELLTREGEPGPASPSFKASDTSSFLVKKPYQMPKESEVDELSEESSSIWEDDWFFGEEDDERSVVSEPSGKK